MTTLATPRRAVPFIAVLLLLALGGGGVALPAGARVTHARGPTIENVVVDCAAGTSCTLTWDAVAKPVQVYAGTTVDAIDRKRPVAETVKGASSVTVTGLDPTERSFFALSARGRAATVAADRSLHFESAPNFRDLGGYETADGRTVQWGKVYRADALSRMTDEDLAAMAELGIKVVCDFRGPSEVQADGADRVPGGAEVVSLPIFDETNDLNASIRSAIVSGDRAQQEAVFGGGKAQQILVDGGRYLATDPAPGKQYTAMLQRLAEPAALPTVLHCTAGKDRTGWASAVILTLLGVPRETVEADYLASNEALAALNESRIQQVKALLYDPELLRPLLEVRPEYLAASFDAVEEEYGSFSRYLRKGLGIDKRTQQRIRQNLLTD